MKRSSSVGIGIVLLAVIALGAPLPQALVERWYSHGLYPALQSAVTPITNMVPFALFDVALLLTLSALGWRMAMAVRRRGWWRGLLHGLWILLVTTAGVYLVFLLTWGLNYRRVPLEARLEYDEGRVTREAARVLATEAVRRVNEGRALALVTPFDEAALIEALGATQRALGARHTAVPGTPKPSLLGLYFRQAAIDGMTNPFFLEVILNPDLLPAERPLVLAHEWAHLAGYAHETEANFVAWLSCLRGDPAAQYSAWLAAYEHASSVLPREDRRALPPLDEGPREDLRAIAARYQRSSPVVRTAARDVYDSYLRANRVPEGIAAYGAVVRLMLGTALDDELMPRTRSD